MMETSSGTASAGAAAQSFLCSTCNTLFKTSESRRAHMKDTWHVYNIKRKMTSLPPVSEDVFAGRVESGKKKARDSSSKSEEDVDDEDQAESKEEDDEDEEFLPTQCIFCNQPSDTLDANIEHMSTTHGLFIPDVEHLVDMEIFLRYLGTIVWTFHECIYCATARDARDGIQRHMTDKGHCMLNFDKEPEMIEFWDFSDSETEEAEVLGRPGEEGRRAPTERKGKGSAKKISDTDILLPSGRIISSRPKTQSFARRILGIRRSAKASKMTELTEADANSSESPVASETASQAPESSSSHSKDTRLVARTHQMGLIGITDSQKRALLVTEKKLQKQEAVTKAAVRWATDKVVNKQKFYRVTTGSVSISMRAK